MAAARSRGGVDRRVPHCGRGWRGNEPRGIARVRVATVVGGYLNRSEKTVRNNITHIFDKMQVENRSQAIVRARDAGLGR